MFVGIVGDWKNVFSESQNEEMDKIFEKHAAKKTKLGAMLKYDEYCKNWEEQLLSRQATSFVF